MREIVVGEFAAVLTRVMVAVVEPAAVGAKRTLKVAACPPFSVNGIAGPLMLNVLAEALADEIFRPVVPLLVTEKL